MVEIFTSLKNCSKSTLVHLLTQKGKGMEVASSNPIIYHGVKPFDCLTGKFHPTKSTKEPFPKIFGSTLFEMAKEDPAIFCITPATPVGSNLLPFMKAFPERCIDVGIAEGHAVALAGGLAKSGRLKVVIAIYATFFQRALDNLFQEICLQRLPVLIALDRAFLSGPDGSTHHGIYDIAFLNAMPELIICQARDGTLLRELMHSAFEWQKPVVLRFPNLGTTLDKASLQKRELGKGEILQEGKEILIIALGHMYQKALELSLLLKEEFGFLPTLFDPIFIKPLDMQALNELLLGHSHLVIIEEHAENAGLGAIISHFIVQNGFTHLTVNHFGVPDRFVDHGENENLYEEIGLTKEKMAAKIIKSFSRKVCL
jgi:1-deoxy-D-xylulose-5-phosphate synthase